MKKTFTTLGFLAVLLCTQSLLAQITPSRLKNQAMNAVGNAIDNKIQQEMNKAATRIVDRYWDRIIGKYYQGLYADGSTTTGGVQFVLTEEVELADIYAFSHSVKIQIQNYKKNGKLSETAYMTLYSQPGQEYLGMITEDAESKKSKSEIFVINDFARNAFAILMTSDGEKSRITYRAVPRQGNVGTPEEVGVAQEITPPTFTELGTKTILGYTCSGYAYTTGQSQNEVWVTAEDVVGMQAMFGPGAVQQQLANTGDYPTGSILELSSTDTASGEKTVMTVVEIATDANVSYTIKEYPATNMADNANK